ncbi:MAG TPA: acetyl-CoA carboxylase biotin carboxylase subunit, partial [Gemmatimonadaceae bacterium]|nr:acetyl-CoA carboxylase biotin carboxylase subunit [Gemmatimonadaceae bacterium]
DEEFRRGEIDIQWLERRVASILERRPPEESVRVAAIAGALLAERDRVARAVSGSVSATSLPGKNGSLVTDSWKQAARIEGLRS